MALAATPTMQRLNKERIRFTDISPSVAAGKFPAKRLLGDPLVVEATIFRDSAELIGASVRFRHESERDYHHAPLTLLGNDRWRGTFPLARLGLYHFTIVAWSDQVATWQDYLRRKWEARDFDVESELQEGALLLRELADRVPRGTGRVPLMQAAMLLADQNHHRDESVRVALDPKFAEASTKYPDPAEIVAHDVSYSIRVEPLRAGFAAWYELFPRSWSPEPGRPGTFRDLLPRLPEFRELGFDVLYFPPIHPIGLTNRKGKNNTAEAGPGDVGSPWAIGNWQGGHDAVEPALGTLDDFRMLVSAAEAHGLEIALDLALNCSPDHPYVQQHPHWFKRRPDGSIAYAENPPKKYQDVYPLDFDNADWPSLWQEILRVVRFWIDQGVKTFRVDNPHTKPVGLWEWLIEQIKRQHPEVIFLSEAFTRPAMMKKLAQIGFSPSYTYFTWRNTKAELAEYLKELTTPAMADFFRPHFFVNTPDILHAYLQKGGKAAFAVRLFLAATLSPLYGIYSGFEFYENIALHEGSEEYLDSEKYEIKHRPADMPGSLKPLIALLNDARRTHPALQQLTNLTFHEIKNDHLLCYSKTTADHSDSLIFVVNLDPHGVQDGTIHLNVASLGLHPDQAYYVFDLLTNQTWIWKGPKNYVRLDPRSAPGHFLVVRTATASEVLMSRPSRTEETRRK
jgi:starch synthase (maltosyl-transferring)